MAWKPNRGDVWGGYAKAWAVLATLIAGIGTWTGIGLALDYVTGFRWLFLPIGMVLGAGGGIYLVYRKYGRDPEA